VLPIPEQTVATDCDPTVHLDVFARDLTSNITI
jgi:hypothetical protein